MPAALLATGPRLPRRRRLRTVAPPGHAATVVLLRDAAGGSRGLPAAPRRDDGLRRRDARLPRRVGRPADGEPATAWAGPPAGDWAGWLGCDEPLARALVCAAVRETFEESGVLLAGPDAAAVVADTTGDDLERDRLALLDRTPSMAELLRRRGLVLRSDLLRPWAHWITPEFEPQRFDTRFFVAAVPPGQRPRDVERRGRRHVWLPVADAVAGTRPASWRCCRRRSWRCASSRPTASVRATCWRPPATVRAGAAAARSRSATAAASMRLVTADREPALPSWARSCAPTTRAR